MMWISRSDFEQRWMEDYKSRGMYFDYGMSFDSDSEKLKRIIGSEGLIEEEDGLGDVALWFGQTSQTAFIVTSFLTRACTMISLPTTDGFMDWNNVKILEEALSELFADINWIGNSGTNDFTLFQKSHGIVSALCAGVDEETGLHLNQYLTKHGLMTPMVVAQTENFFEDWSGCGTNEGHQHLVCRYTDRYAAERYFEDCKNKYPNLEYEIRCTKQLPNGKWQLLRQDDKGNEFLVEQFDYHVDAKFAELEFETHPHHQVYWVKRAGVT